MYGNEEKFLAWTDSLRGLFGNDATDDLMANVRTMLVRMDRRRAQDIRDMEAAKLLPGGAVAVMEKQQCHLSTVYRRVSRAQKLARKMQAATNQA